MKPILPPALSNKQTAKKLFLFGVMLSFSATLFAQAPTITSFSPASGAVGTLVTINGANLGTPTAFNIGGVTALVINNTGTVLTGFVMPGAATGAISLTTSHGTATGSGNFTVTPTLHPGAQQGGKLVGTGNTGAASQGYSVAVSADGNTAIVGGNQDNSNQGAAWIYTRSGGAWSQQGGKLVGTGNIGAAQQGYSVSLSADGNTAIVGGYADHSSDGAAWVFTRSGGAWSQQGGKLVGTGNPGASQGSSVSLSADGNTAIVGGYQDNFNQGATWVFTRSGGAWSQQGGKLVGTGNTGAANQGVSVSLSADGNTAIVGGYFDNNGQGAAWVYTRSGGAWGQQGGKLVGTGNTGPANQGLSVAISADGNTAIVGGDGDNNNQGAAWVYIRNGGVWGQQGGKLVGTGNTGPAAQGVSVSLSADGNTAIAGGYNDNSGQGAAWVYTRSGGAWGQQCSKLVSAGNTGLAYQGYSVSLSADGNTAIAGGYQDNSFQGAAWVYIALPPPTITSFSPASGSVGTLVTINGANLGSPTAFSIGGVTALIINNTGTVLTGFVMPGAATGAISVTANCGTATGTGNFIVTPTLHPGAQQGGKLIGTGNTGAALQGYSVSLSADGNTAIVGGLADNSDQGAAWVYTRSGGAWVQQGGKLVGTGNTGKASQGYSVSLSADGNTAIVGGDNDNSGQGAAWVYTRIGGAWGQQGGKLVGTGNTGVAGQGGAVSLSADGNTAIVGGNNDNSNQGAAWVYTRSGGTWGQQGGKLVGTGNTGAADQGVSVSLSADGNTAIVGGDFDNSSQGAAWIYTRSGGAWGQQGGKLVGTGGTGAAYQGYSVSISADGNTAMVGGFGDNSNQGAAWVYIRNGGVWGQQGGKLAGTGNTGTAGQGVSVSLSADGNTAIVGGYNDNSGQGAAWVYTRSGGAWGQQGSKLVGTGNTGAAFQGYSVSLSADGNTAMVGGYQDNSNQGTAWAYTAAPTDATLSALKLSTGALTPVFATGTTSYTASVPYAASTITVTPTTSVGTATIKVNGTTVASGTPSGAIALSVGANTITTVVTNGASTKTYTVMVTRAAASNNAYLATINLTPAASLTAVSGPDYQDYTASVSNTTSSVTVTFTTHDPMATVKVNGTTVASGTASGPIALSVGPNTITIVSTAQDGVTTKTYGITVTRVSSSPASLSALQLSSGALTPVFATGTTSYTASVLYAASTITVTPTTSVGTATIKVNGTTVASGAASGPIALSVGANTITTVVTNGASTKTYTVTVTRAAASNNAYLATINLTPAASLTVVSGPDYQDYTASVPNTTSSVTVTFTTHDPTATVKVNGTTVASGTPSGAIALSVGPNTITIVSTAQDGVTTKTYGITVTRVSSSPASLSALQLSSGTLTPVFATGTTSYTASVLYAASTITVTPTTSVGTATIKVNGTTVASGAASGPIALSVGANTITTVVTNGASTKTYTVTVTRAAASNNAYLATINLTPAASLTVVSGPDYKDYTASVPNTTGSVTVTFTTHDPTATVKVNGTTVASGTPSGAIALSVGPNTITVVSTAQDGVTTKTYGITVTRMGPVNIPDATVSVTKPAESPQLAQEIVVVHPGVSPNGDGINDFLQIDGILAYPDNKLLIMNRNGLLVYEAKGYDNSTRVFDGHSNKNGQMQLPGTYFYSLDYTINGIIKHKTGFLVLKY